MSEQRVTRNVLNLLSAATALAEILDYPIIKGRIHIGFQNAAELIKKRAGSGKSGVGRCS